MGNSLMTEGVRRLSERSKYIKERDEKGAAREWKEADDNDH